MSTKTILHVDVDAFLASVEQILNPELKGRPVIVGGTEGDSSVVASASYEARNVGVRTAMTIAQAYRLCPQGAFLRGNYHNYEKVSNEIIAILHDFSPDVEVVSLDDVYVDLTGFERLYGAPIDTAERIKTRINDTTGLNVTIGIGTSKLVARMATDLAKANGIAIIWPGYESEFLAPLDIAKLPGVGNATRKALEMFNINTIGELARIDERLAKVTFGKNGLLLIERARGVDKREVETKSPKSISRETTFENDIGDKHVIEAMLYYLTERAARKLRQLHMLAKAVRVKVRYADFETYVRSQSLPRPTDCDTEIYSAALRLLQSMLTRRVRVRLIGICVAELMPGQHQQIELLDNERQAKLGRFYRNLDTIRDKFGFSAVTVGRSIALMNKMEKDFHGFKLRTSCLTR